VKEMLDEENVWSQTFLDEALFTLQKHTLNSLNYIQTDVRDDDKY